MAEQIMVVCDVCASAPAETVGITARGSSYRKDLCSEHLRELLRGTSAPRRGRPPKPRAISTTSNQEGPKRRGRPPRLQPSERTRASEPAAKRPRRKITDPAILAKRRASLEKARAARKAKRLAAQSS
jgi:hypothetical protein